MATTQRKYRITDVVLLEHAALISQHFAKYAERFLHFNEVKYGDSFLESLQQDIKKAKKLVEESESALRQKAITTEIRELTKELIKSLQYLRVHVLDTYEDNPTKISEFNLNRITIHSPNPDVFITYCKQVLGSIALHCKELIRNGLKEEILDNTLLKLEQLNTLRSKQLKTKISRTLSTENRVNTLNQLFMKIKKLRDASVYVFNDEPEKTALFALPKNTYGNRKKMSKSPKSAANNEVETT